MSHHHAKQRVRADATGIHLVEPALMKKRLQHRGERTQRGKPSHVFSNDLRARRPVRDVKTNVKLMSAFDFFEFHDGHARFGYELYLHSHAASRQGDGERLQTQTRIFCTTVQDHGIDVRARQVHAGRKRTVNFESSVGPDPVHHRSHAFDGGGARRRFLLGGL